ncbi:MAG: purine-nucleoside phosphorylase [Defluviitaleaceae bacterium]|nr:purine-nucleoside phosphorylase [Defluviitaleaceae bacterium]MCL2605423.1 purine-nucleoside phosphorylase [Defluviitaleaceae bacterium]
MPIPTPHITAKAGDYAKTVLMPGDPLRAKFIAENYLENPVKVNGVRGMLGYTGTYNGKPVSVQGSGMGVPSIGIYSYELFNFYEVDNIIRIGSAGALDLNLELGDIVLGMGACTDSDYAKQYHLPGTYAPIASYELLRKAQGAADLVGKPVTVGNVLTTDLFYADASETLKYWVKMGVLAVEMEAAGLYMNAARAGKNALCMCTISDICFTDQAMSAKDREKSLTDMMEVALTMLLMD